ncbi:hypothetical protein [Terricaulis sp.]|uniref:hypothetical protein n=1 Tax=Terricaulis sp. TaxID=2768686 RepID=UPI002AC78B4A|nr:hypothetical protein [Terricaulis sp.]MDZ4691663.1 hypothetical protein [Terricaulis sp.]
MSLNKTLDRLFDEIRREAKRNPDFADRLDAVLQRHDSRRDVPDGVMDDVAPDEAPVKKAKPAKPVVVEAPPAKAPALNPAGVYKKDGEDALTAALVALDTAALRALVEENNLDPAGETPAMDEAELVAHIVAQAKRRAERDEKMFDY